MSANVDLCEVAAALERVHAEMVLRQVYAMAADRTDAYWSGFAHAVEEVACRLGMSCEEPAA